MTVPTFKLHQVHPVTSIESKSMLEKNFGLTEEQFNKMLKAMKQGDDSLFEHIYLSHYEKCIKYLKKFRSATKELAYRATMQALLETRKELIQGKLGYDNLAYLFTNKAGKKLGKIRGLRKECMEISSIEGMDFKDSSSFLDDLQSKEMTDYVGKALKELEQAETVLAEKQKKAGKNPPRETCSNLLRLYYYDNLSYPEIAKIYYPTSTEAEITTKANTLARRVKRKCLENLKFLLKGHLKEFFDG